MGGALGSVERAERHKWLTGEELDPVRDLAAYLRGEWQAGYPLRLTIWQSDAVGQQLSEAEVSRLEVVNAVIRLPYRQKRVIQLLYGVGEGGQTVDPLPWREVSTRLRISADTISSDRRAGLARMAELIAERPVVQN